MGVLRVNLKSLAYFVEVAKDLSITGAAQRLYLSQQALSLQIQKLERYYGVTLFERQPRFRLTSAGELLLEGAQKILRENDAIVNSLAEISESHAGTLRIGIPAYRAAECFPLVMPAFHQRWPHVSLHIEEGPSEEMLQKIYAGELDILVGTPTREEVRTLSDRLEFSLLIDDRTYMICSDRLLEQYFGDAAGAIKAKSAAGLDLRDFASLPFMLHKPPMRLRNIEDACFCDAGYKPNISIETSNTELMIALYPCHFAAFFCRRSRLRSLIGAFPDCNAFPLRERGGLDQSLVYLVRHKSQKLPRHMAEFSRMMHDAWEKIAEY